MNRSLCAALACILVAGAAPAAEPVIYGKVLQPAGKRDTAKEERNITLVMDWMHHFWVNSELDSWAKWMKPDFINHDAREPIVGAQALVDWLKARTAESAAKNPGRPPVQHKDNDHLFVFADGDYVILTGIPGVNASNYDPKLPTTNLSGNIIRVENGKIAEWWFYGSNNRTIDNYNNLKVLGLSTMGPPAAAPAGGAAAPNAPAPADRAPGF